MDSTNSTMRKKKMRTAPKTNTQKIKSGETRLDEIETTLDKIKNLKRDSVITTRVVLRENWIQRRDFSTCLGKVTK